MFRRAVTLGFVLLLALTHGCGGGGGVEAAPFVVSGTSPAPGDVDVPVDGSLVVTFSGPADLSTVSTVSFFLEDATGARVNGSISSSPSSQTTVRLLPTFALGANRIYRAVMRGSVLSSDGTPLGSDFVWSFVTSNPFPTVRPDQVRDLGNVLSVGRYLARSIRLKDGRTLVMGGYSSPSTVTDTAEIYDPATGLFRLLATRMISPRAEHAATLLADGRVLVCGGVSISGGPPLATSEIFSPPQEAFGAGPDMTFGRRAHACSELTGGGSALVTGGFGSDGKARNDGERLSGNAWVLIPTLLGDGTAQHVQVSLGGDTVYIGVGNFTGNAALYDGATFAAFLEADARFRAEAVRVESNKVFVVGGDTRSMVTYDLGRNRTTLATDFLFERRGAYTLTHRGAATRFLAAGGFHIGLPGAPALASMEVIDFVTGEPGPFHDARAYYVNNVFLPVPFAGHIAIETADGATLLAGGIGDGVGAHSRRGVLVAVD